MVLSAVREKVVVPVLTSVWVVIDGIIRQDYEGNHALWGYGTEVETMLVYF